MQPDPTPDKKVTNLSISAHEFEALITQTYSPETQGILRFWFFAAKDRSWSLSKLATVTDVSATVLSRLFRGIYPADTDNMTAKLLKAKETFADSADNPDFIETSLSKRLFTIFDKTRALRNVSLLWGPMGIGKTACINEYRRLNNHGGTLVLRFPAGATFAFFVSSLARITGVPTRSKSAFCQREDIIKVLASGQRLLIIDELHQAFLTTRTDTAVRCCELLREISDIAMCGLVLVGTELLEESVFRGPHKEALGQLVDRGTVQVPLPARATQKDYLRFLQYYGLDFPDGSQDPEASGILNDIIKYSGLRKLTLHLRDGSAYAGKRGETYQWSHFVAAFKAIQSLSK